MPRHQRRLRDPRGGSRPLGRAGIRVPPSGETGKAYPVIGKPPPPGTCCVQRSFLIPGKGGSLVGCRLDPPVRPARPSGSPANTGTEKSSTVPSRGTEKRNIPACQTAGTLPRQHPTPLGAPHPTHYAPLRVSHPTRAPEGQNPKRPPTHQGNPVRPLYHVATRPAATQAVARHLNRRHRQMAERNLTPGGPPVDATEKQNQPSPGGVHHPSRLHFLERAIVSIRLTRLRRSGR